MEIQLRDYQEPAVEELRENFRRGTVNQVLSAPTGSGKTEIAAYLTEACRQKGTPVIFAVDRLSLVEQTSERFDGYGIPHGIVQADHPRCEPWQKVQIASIQTLARRKWPEHGLLILDECHSMYAAATNHIVSRGVRTIGLTATPFVRGLGKHYDAVVSVTSTNALIEAGYLCGYQIYAPSEPDMTGAKVVAGEWTEDEAAKRSMPIVGDCVAEYLNKGEGRKFICFGVNVAHCEELQRQFMAVGIHVGLYTYHTGDDERKRMVEEFRSPGSYIRGLISVSALAKGFDVPDVGVLICARPLRSSLAEWVQMFGRGLRPHPSKQRCIVLDHSGNAQRFWERMQDFFENGCTELDDGTRKESKPREKKEKQPAKCPKCSCLHRPAPSCPSCGFVYSRRSEIIHEAGALSEVRQAYATRAEQQRLFSELLGAARQKGYSAGWASHKFREKVGRFPPRYLDTFPVDPSPETLRWILSRQIAFAQAKKRSGRRAA